jgi:hypothetical protein
MKLKIELTPKLNPKKKKKILKKKKVKTPGIQQIILDFKRRLFNDRGFWVMITTFVLFFVG